MLKIPYKAFMPSEARDIAVSCRGWVEKPRKSYCTDVAYKEIAGMKSVGGGGGGGGKAPCLR